MSDYLHDKEGDDAEIERLEQLLGGFVHTEELRPPWRRPRTAWIASAVVLATAAAVALVLAWPDRDAPTPPVAEEPAVIASDPPPAAVDCGRSGPGFPFAAEGGRARCGTGSAQAGVLPVGEWLETSAAVSARVEVADIGALTVHADSRVRLVETGPAEHRMQLARGRVSASVVAPPRLFVVDTPAGSAVDLGCAYELAVDDRERTHLAVEAGSVSLEGAGLVAWVPAGSEVVAEPGRGPGTPVATGAELRLREAVAKFDGGDASALAGVLALAGAQDTGTLWNLLLRTEGSAREKVYRRLDALSPHPPEIRERDILAGDRAALETWRDRLPG